jgi:putative membrane protein
VRRVSRTPGRGPAIPASPYLLGPRPDYHGSNTGAIAARIVDVTAKPPRCAGMKFLEKERLFWAESLTIAGSALPLILPRALLFGLFALAVTVVHFDEDLPALNLEITPFEVAGGILSLLLVLRTNAGYERWWEGRRLWGDIVNRSRNLAVVALSYGPDDPGWRDQIVRRTAAFSHAARMSLRGDRTPKDVGRLLGAEAEPLIAADHMPTAVALLIGESVREARDRLDLDGFTLLRIDSERAGLIDDIGGCERIIKTRLPLAYRVEIRRILILFVLAIPFALVDRLDWFTPIATVLISVPLLAIDKIGTELQDPFSEGSLNHLPLVEICATIEGNLLAMLDQRTAALDGGLSWNDRIGRFCARCSHGYFWLYNRARAMPCRPIPRRNGTASPLASRPT